MESVMISIQPKWCALIGCFVDIAIICIFLVGIVFSAIQCVAETRMSIEVIRSGKVPTEVSFEK